MKNFLSSSFFAVLISCGICLSSFSLPYDPYLPEEGENYEKGQKNISSFNGRETYYNLFSDFKTDSLINSGKLVITIDDGPGPYTETILSLLDKYQENHRNKYGRPIRASFFVVGDRIRIFKNKAVSILKHGHHLAAHSMTHPLFNKRSRKTFESELKDSLRGVATVYEKAGVDQKSYMFRFPFADYGKRADYHHFNSIRSVSKKLFNQNNCVHFVFWDIDPGDWMPGIHSSRIFSNFVASFEGGKYWSRKYSKSQGRFIDKEIGTNGGVLLLHSNSKKSIIALEKILDYAEENQIEFVSLEDVEEYTYGMENCGVNALHSTNI